jgi:hypothetical protein
MPYTFEKGVFPGELLEQIPRAIDRAVVDDDDLVPLRVRLERDTGLSQELWKIFSFVFRGDENADFGARGGWLIIRSPESLGGFGLSRRRHTRLRMRAESTPS